MKPVLFIDLKAIMKPGSPSGRKSIDLAQEVIIWLFRIQHTGGYATFLVSGQRNREVKNLIALLSTQGIKLTTIFARQENWQKQMVKISQKHSPAVFIGSEIESCRIAAAHGLSALYFGDSASELPKIDSWKAICEFLLTPPRIATVERHTNETQISMTLNLDGKGVAKIDSGIGFLNHMLDLLCKHAGVDIEAKIRGDLHVDEHHTIEDTAILLGQAFHQALGHKAGIERYGFFLPMDESHCRVAIDFSGRSALTWKVTFSREKIGDMPTELFRHFFKSFSDEARCGLYIKAKGKNEHHKIEAIFKAFGRSVRAAVKRNAGSTEIPSTKGIL
jgi:imidazoleglycerol-phosphate dehydratase/histidinol-phosphatase